jgi:hypothetical protein
MHLILFILTVTLAYLCFTSKLFDLAPGGCTIAGLLTLEDGRVRSTIARAIQVATERASVLGQPAHGTARKGTGSPEARD